MNIWTVFKRQVIFLTLFSISSVYAQKTITKKDYRGRMYEQYQVDANGSYHGFYKKFFDNGFTESEVNYVKGKRKSEKNYEYIGKQRLLVYDATFDSKGRILTKTIREFSMYGDVNPLKQVAGLLKSGRWYLYNNIGNYCEEYNGNDTTYSWKDKTKKQFVGKFLNDEYVLNKEDLETKRIELAQLRAKEIQDSIKNAKYYEEQKLKRTLEQQKFEAEYTQKRKTKDSLATLQKFIIDTDILYSKLVIDNYNGEEGTLYNKLASYLTNKKNTDTILQKLIADAIGIKYNELSRYKIQTGWTNVDYNKEYGIWAIVKGSNKSENQGVLLVCSKGNRKSELNGMHKDQLALISIINYVKEHSIAL